jgi:hypothetical protein
MPKGKVKIIFIFGYYLLFLNIWSGWKQKEGLVGGGGVFNYYIKLRINWPKRSGGRGGNTRYSGTSIQEFPPLRITILAPKIKRHKSGSLSLMERHLKIIIIFKVSCLSWPTSTHIRCHPLIVFNFLYIFWISYEKKYKI